MLVLTRRTGDSIVIGHQIVVTVLDVRGEQVRIGIDAPRDVQVHREEVYRQLVAENTAAVASAERVAALRARLAKPPGTRPHRVPPRTPRREAGAEGPSPSGA